MSFRSLTCLLCIAFLVANERRLLWSVNFFIIESIICEQVLVQLGDILDRGEDEIAILSLLKSLDIQAKALGGAVFQVLISFAIYACLCLCF